MNKVFGGIALGALVVAGLAAQSRQAPSTRGTTGTLPVPTATAMLTDANGGSVGTARLQQTPHGVLMKLDLQDATPGVHALHIHEAGRCEPPSFQSAGNHFEPSQRQHGFLNLDGPHAGDIPNIDVPPTRRLTVEHLLSGVTLDDGPRSLLHADGSAIIIHADEDDYASDPSGNAGDRIACGRIEG